ncbi:MAG TPA: ABC transporter ATP-binding protein [Chromatiales bacterium]|nr:ABC transporter ATP-binding protein [Chromatiales bacterium]
MSELLAIRGVEVRFGPVAALRGLDLEVRPGEVVGLLGHNGAGKTTTMKLALGLLRPRSGRVRLLGVDPAGPEGRRARARVGFLPENVSFYDSLTGREVLRYLARLKGRPAAEADRLLEQVGLGHAADRRVRTWSKGMRQRLGLAQALLGRPALLLLDEPTVGLDPMATAELYATIGRLRSEGVGVVLCSHVLAGIERHIDRCVIVGHGRVLAAGTLEELRARARLPIRIRVRGHWREPPLQGLGEGEGVVARRLNGHQIELEVAPERKLSVLRALAAEPGVEDLDVRPPGLETLYAHFDAMLHRGSRDGGREAP